MKVFQNPVWPGHDFLVLGKVPHGRHYLGTVAIRMLLGIPGAFELRFPDPETGL